MGVRTSRLGAAELVWDEQTREGLLHFVDEAAAAGSPEAEQLTGDFERWLEDAPAGRFRLLVDCTEIASIDAGWRQGWADFFLGHRDEAVIAWFNASPEVALIITMFRKGTGVRGEAFATEQEAREYLAANSS
ncbi:MAG: hypothetical protein WEB03_15205 [Nitriliruptor sp.]|uniref:hypothetical protein n=1 Tax=Nitriliruptor sp. TaxID=2448056 RepID=UPI0034A00779